MLGFQAKLIFGIRIFFTHSNYISNLYFLNLRSHPSNLFFVACFRGASFLRRPPLSFQTEIAAKRDRGGFGKYRRGSNCGLFTPALMSSAKNLLIASQTPPFFFQAKNDDETCPKSERKSSSYIFSPPGTSWRDFRIEIWHNSGAKIGKKNRPKSISRPPSSSGPAGW